MSKQKITDTIKSNFSKEWKQYLVWKKNLMDQKIRRYKIGNFDFNNPDTVVVSQDFYNLPMYRERDNTKFRKVDYRY